MIFRIICLLCVGFTTCQTSSEHTSQIDDAMKYLSKFGYMQQHDPQLDPIVHEDTFTDAIRQFQNFAHLKVTGQLSNETIKMMKMPRCGVKDKRNQRPVEHSRFRRYVLQGSKWRDLKLTYRITKYPSGLGKSETNREVQRAFEEWSKVSQLSFIQQTCGKANIEIRFESGDHGDYDPFDGRGGTLAHAGFPDGGGDVHFDDDEVWTLHASKQGTNLFRVAVHEFGHSLGLGHSDIKGAIMYPFYSSSDKNFQFHQDDIDGIQRLYGKNEIDLGDEELTTIKIDTTETPIDPNNGGSDTDLCKDGKFDAIFTSLLGSIYILRGSSYWQLGRDGLNPGYPKPISEKWTDLPSNIDAAFSRSNGEIYFFKGSKFWRYNDDGTLDKGNPHDMSEIFEGVPSNIDAAIWVHHLNQGFFFKGDKYWVYKPNNDDKVSVRSSYPKSISNFKGIPSNLDDVLLAGKKVYFFKNGSYYQINNYALEFQVSSSTFPENVRKSFFQCSL